MGQPAVAIPLTQSPEPEFESVPRDFSQPWLDLNDKAVLVTGGTESFGKHFLKTIVERYTPRRLIIFSRDELKQSEMAETYPPEPKARVISCEKFADWDTLMPKVRDELVRFAGA